MTFFWISHHSGHEPPRTGVFSPQHPVLPSACLLLTLPISWFDAHGALVFIGSFEVSDSKAQEQLLYGKRAEGFCVSCPLGLGQEWFLLLSWSTKILHCVCRNHAKRGVVLWQVPKSWISSMLKFGVKGNSVAQLVQMCSGWSLWPDTF